MLTTIHSVLAQGTPHHLKYYGDSTNISQASVTVIDNMLLKVRENLSDNWLMYLFVLAAGGIWGVTFSLARIATESGLHPLGLAWWQAAGGGLMNLCFCLFARDKLKNILQLAWPMTVIGFCGSVVPGTLLFYAAVHVPAGILAISIAVTPMLTYLASVVLKVEAFKSRRVTGVLLGFIAIVLIMRPGSVESLQASENSNVTFWILLALLSCCFYTLENLFVEKRISAEVYMPLLLGGGMLIAALLMLPFVVATGAWVTLSVPLDKAEWSVIFMILASGSAYLMYLILIRRAGAVFASLTGYVVTLSGVFWGIAIFAESHSQWIWLALLVMIIGMFLVTPRTDKRLEMEKN